MSDMQDRVRLDKWLWAARFYKTRGLAQDAIEAGHVSLNGERAKASRLVKTADRIELRLNQLEYVLDVLLPLDRRGSATVARTMYQETAESVAERERLAEQHRLAPEPASTIALQHDGRPSKRDRRSMDRVRHQWNDRWSASWDGN